MKDSAMSQAADYSVAEKAEKLTTELCDALIVAFEEEQLHVAADAVASLMEFVAFRVSKADAASALTIITVSDFVQKCVLSAAQKPSH